MRNLSTKFLAVLFLSLFTWACEDDTPDIVLADQAAVSDEMSQSKTTDNAKKKKSDFLRNLEVDGELSDGGSFEGVVTITEFNYDEKKGLLVSGVLTGTATTDEGTEEVTKEFSGIPATLNETSGSNARLAAQQQECQILFLDIGPISLNLLGLQVDLSEIVLDITAVSGSGNLLGNLLCAVAGLLDPFGFLDQLIGGLEGLLNLLNLINDIIG